MNIKALTLALLVTVAPAFAMKENEPQDNFSSKRKRVEISTSEKGSQEESTIEKGPENGPKRRRADGSDDRTDFQGEKEEINPGNSLLGTLPLEIELKYLYLLDHDGLRSYLHSPSNAKRLKKIRERCEKIYVLISRSSFEISRLKCSAQDILNYGMGRPVLSLQYKAGESTDEDLKLFCDILKTLNSIKSIKLSGLNFWQYPELPPSLKLVFQTLETIKVEELEIKDGILREDADIFLRDVWAHILKMKTLKKLSLKSNSNRLPEQIFKDLIEVELLLTDFNVEGMEFETDTATQLGFWIAGSPSLKRVVMNHATFPLKGMKYLAMGIGRNRNFESFDVSGCHVTEKSYPEFPAFLEIMRGEPKIITGLKLIEENSAEGTNTLTASLSVPHPSQF